MIKDIALWLQSRPQGTKFLIVGVADLMLLTAAVFASYALRVSDFVMPATGRLHLYLVAPLLSVACAAAFGIYSSAARNYSTSLERRLLASQLAVPLPWSFLLLFFGTSGFARSTVIIYTLLAMVGMILLRRGAAWLLAMGDRSKLPTHQQPRVLIYGAGPDGMQLVDALRRQGRFKPVAFLDTDYTLVGRTVAGLRVFAMEEMDTVLRRSGPREVIIAKPQQTRANRRVLVDMLLSKGLTVKTMPGHAEIMEGKLDVTDVRPVRLEDLLGRDPVAPDRALMEKAVKDRVVLVTGAGGSIGSELVRQAAPFGPRKIVLLDSSEFSLFEINREMESRQRGSAISPEIKAVLADVTDQEGLERIMRENGVEVVFHAAAYKHVRMVQENARAGLVNNIWGTRAAALAAIATGVRLFVLISTDKAVRPTSVMGASKRVAEMLVQALAAKTGKKPVFAMVRFGNVLGSTGSVVPIFQRQIERGGPVEVTDPEVTRYFMLIPEAAQLVIQAGAMAEGGEVFVLDMGESVKIVQLAETMIELAGLTRKSAENPDGDIEIRFIGLRDGEKLYEELQIGREVFSTSHPRIMQSREVFFDWPRIERELKGMSAASDARAVQKLMDIAHYGSK